MPTTAQLRDRSRLKPVYLIEITLKNSGPTLYLSDKNIQIGSQIYEDYISTLSGIEDELKRADSSALNADITLTFKNDKWKTYNYLIEAGETYPFEGADCVIKETYYDDNSASWTTPETVFKGALDEPSDIDLMGFKCKVSSMVYAKDRLWKQNVIDKTTYPNAYEDVGKVEPIVYGKRMSAGIQIPALRINWGAKTVLNLSIDATVTTLEASDTSRFPSSGSVWIDDEKIGYTSVGGYTFSNLTRGQGGTTATPHRAGAVVWEHKTQYDSLLADHELYAVGSQPLAEIDGNFFRVLSGVSGIFEGGKHKLRATSQIRIQRVKDNTVEKISGVMKTVTPNGATGTADNPTNAIDGSEATFSLMPQNMNATLNITFPTTSYGALTKQYLWVTFSANFYGENDILDITLGGWSPAFLTPTGTGGNKVTVRLQKTGGLWGDGVNFQNNCVNATFNIYEVWKEVEYEGIITKTGDIVGTREVDRFHASCWGYKDPDGNYGGIGSNIARPDWVIKHFLIHRMGFSLSDIDNTSFTNAGSLYDNHYSESHSYIFGFAIMDKIKPSEFLKQLAFECRSTIKYIAGKWYLDFIPDTTPSAIRTITHTELAGEGAKFVFNKTSILDIANDLTAKCWKNYSKINSESDWNYTVKVSDSASKTKYGTYPKEFELELIGHENGVASCVLAHILKQRKTPLLVIEFPVFWEHFDLKVGDTIEIDNPLYDAKKFFIEEIRRTDKSKAEVRAIEWW